MIRFLELDVIFFLSGPSSNLDGLDLEMQPDEGEHQTLQVLQVNLKFVLHKYTITWTR